MKCNCQQNKGTPYDQSLSEIEFQRGIWQAALNNNIPKVKELLSKGYNVNEIDVSGYTALHYAARNKHFEMVKLLLEHNACVNCTTKAGQDTPLHRAAYVGHLGIVKALVNKGACTDLRNIDGQTCLHKAVQRGHTDIVKFLLAHNPNLSSIEDNKITVGGGLPFNGELVYNYHYTVFAERKDCERNIPEYEGETPKDYPGDSSQCSVAGWDY